MSRMPKLPLAVTMGEPAGIGGDILLKAWVEHGGALPPFFVIDEPARLVGLARRLGLEVPVREITTPAEARDTFHQALPVLAQSLATSVIPGSPDPRNAPAVIASIDRAVALTLGGEAAGVVTLPISKHILHQGGFTHPGHTEYLAELAQKAGYPAVAPIMMLSCDAVKVIPVTVHLSLRDAIVSLTSEAIVTAGRQVAQSLRDFFARPNPRLAVAALNPHGGENGDMGREEIDIIAPAVAQLQAEGIDAFGPAPADTLFHPEARDGYDACLCMYHDQALIPIKTIDFHHGVNVTLGLPFIRTSPDHGTAFGIAGSGKANPSSFVAALRQAAEMVIRHERAVLAAERAAAHTPS